jgi:hypothetical protein
MIDDVHIELLIEQARNYSRAPLIKYLRDGGIVTPALAAFLAEVLEGRVPKPRVRLGDEGRALPKRIYKSPNWIVRGVHNFHREIAERYHAGECGYDEAEVLKDWLKRGGCDEPRAASVAELTAALTRHRFRFTRSQLEDALRRKKRKVKTMR